MKNTLKSIILPLIIILIISITTALGAWEEFEHILYDHWFNLRGVATPSNAVVIIAIDDPSIYELNFPIARDVHAQLLEQLSEARVVAFDLLFDTHTDAVADTAFAQAITEHGRVVLAFASLGIQQHEGEFYQDLRFPIPELAHGVAGIGFINMPVDFDNVVRRVLTVNPTAENMYLPGFHLATLMVAHGLTPEHLYFKKPHLLAVGEQLQIPVDQNLKMLTNFWGPKATFETISYLDVLHGKIKPAFFAGKMVLIGPTTPLAQDFYPTPFTQGNIIQQGALPTPGVELHAGAIETYLTGQFFQRADPLINMLLLFLTGIIAAIVIRRLNPWTGVIFVFTLGLVLTAGTYFTWLHAYYWLNLVAPLLMVAFMYTGVTAENFLKAELEKRRTRSTFGRYVSPAVMEEILKNKKLLTLGGNRREITILFSDIRQFTTFSDTHQAEVVVNKLNEYLTGMTATIFKNGGTLDKYLGDGIMAVFGAPVACPDHADRAVKTAAAMIQELAKLNAVWKAQGKSPFEIGIGISSGEVIVGNVGSPERMDYTVIGGDVNLAARLENLTKKHQTPLIISERTYSLLNNPDELPLQFKPAGEVAVRGITKSVKIYVIADQS